MCETSENAATAKDCKTKLYEDDGSIQNKPDETNFPIAERILSTL